MAKLQQTILNEASLSGVGVHTGNQTTMTFKPAPAGTGIRFIRTDLPGAPEVPALIGNVVETARGTTIGVLVDGQMVKVHTVEHVLASVAALEIDNIRIELDNNEPPIGDGSALPFYGKLKQAGLVELDAPRRYFDLPQVVSVADGSVQLVANPNPGPLRISFTIDFNHQVLKSQYASFEIGREVFEKELAASRTFCLARDVEHLRAQGLIKGGSLQTAVVIGEHGIENKEPLRFPDEFVRHKILDLLGDLTLLGMPLRAHVISIKSGHRSNVKLVAAIKQVYDDIERQKQGPVFDINAIAQVMPHRYPFLLVDRILELEEGKRVVGIKNVTFNEPFFQGHFPGRPVFPGVLIIEALAQTGGFMILHSVENPEKTLLFFAAIDKVRFRKPVVPGDQLRFELSMISFKRGICKMDGKALVDGQVVCEAELTAAMVDR
ncbi:MAG TPA: bifunctional UDP-3-O-[3-hydroxymyristoyl] N-acetylglucosamine deacetylase/3-hydroxyacyl-ACP dehydratase [Candidatus Edwardsbacteria bacterium]|nr:bifunctional UDP-3-O-[3-hydroxymyristoyl] N-acetylglucosamine deacetylase/3-hydroxyacyl-ACP dehydratase [Candidatus Edwardsbacteria bacterium]